MGNEYQSTGNCKALSCLADVCMPFVSVGGRQQLQSANSETLLQPEHELHSAHMISLYQGPVVWNSLLTELRTACCSVDIYANLRTVYFAFYKCYYY